MIVINVQDHSHMNSSRNNESIKILFKRPPFPPNIDPVEIAKKRFVKMRDPKKINSRGPNCFMIYRSYCTSINGASRSRRRNRIPMTTLSMMIAESWDSEPQVVKNYYKELSALTEVELIKQRRRNEIQFLPCEEKCKNPRSPDDNSRKINPKDFDPPTMEDLKLNAENNESRLLDSHEHLDWAPFTYEPLEMFACSDHGILECPCQYSAF
ncbi:2491_t:CDS:1 [Acaulospora morrowiae]|uniref:2491_t:CDS:1 n=1 Tax=Acaulospora morrowiae TaxID=94023 RepID=A0A9N9CVF1_9GLOM|nr:2491_t:CDS:1 [Acaulospora morrowiae]